MNHNNPLNTNKRSGCIRNPRLSNKLLHHILEPQRSILKTQQTDLQASKSVTFEFQATPISISLHSGEACFSGTDLILEYVSECEFHKVKPIELVIKQLELYDIIDGRIPSFTLKNVKLDCKSIESLEIIFLNLSFEHLDLDSTSLDEDTCVSLCEILEYYSPTISLSLGNNTRIGLRGWAAISQMLVHNTVLETFNLNRMIFTDMAVNFLSRALRLSSNLRVLYLNNCYLNGARLRVLCGSLSQTTCSVEELYLAENKISSSDCECIADVLKNNRNLRIIDLESNPIQDNGLKILCSEMVNSEVSNLEVLQLWNTGITSLGVSFLAAYISNERFNKMGICLRTLNIGKNKIGDDGLIVLKPVLIRNNTIERLGLASTRLSPTGIITLAEIIADNRKLNRIDLRDNNVSIAGVLALSQSLRHNSTLLRVNFNTNFKIDAGMESELNRILDEIRLKCSQNRANARTHMNGDDGSSILSSISSDSSVIPRVSLDTSFSFTSFIMNIITSPLRFSKLRLFNTSSKVDIEMKAVPEIIEPKEENDIESNDGLQSHEKLSSSLPDLCITETLAPITPQAQYNVSRFEVRKVTQQPHATHRRCSSENINQYSSKSNGVATNAFIKLRPPDQQLPALNTIPSEEVNLSPILETIMLPNKNRPERSKSEDIGRKSNPSLKKHRKNSKAEVAIT